MTAANQTIVTLYELEGLSPEQIAEAECFELAAVKSVLMQFSRMYKEKMKIGEEEGFTDAEEKACRQVLAQLAQYSEDDHIRLRAAMYIRNDKKGRLDIAKAQTGLNLNITMINEGIAQALERANISKSKVIELAPHEVKLLEQAERKIV